MSKHKIGDKVRCINDIGWRYLRKGEVYLVIDTNNVADIKVFPDKDIYYWSMRFELVESSKAALAPPFQAGETYRTRDGREAKIYATDGAGRFPIHGCLNGRMMVWTADGKATHGEHFGDIDLMPARLEPIKVKMWANVYEGDVHDLHATAKEAQETADDEALRIAVPVMVTEIKDEQ